MYVKILLAAAALSIAAPALAKSKAPVDPTAGLPTGPVAYSQLADVDAKMNPAAPVKAKKVMKHKAKAKAPAADAAAPAAK